MKNTTKKGIMLLALLMSFTLSATDIYAAGSDDGTKVEAGEKTGDETKGKSLILEKTEGTVEIENAKGKIIDLRNGSKMYNGYRITTEEGYAWLALDGTKLIKLDWNSEVSVKKNRKKYEVMLESGSLFFNVSKPLEKDENLDIRTSTMSTGIRGTLGKVTSEGVQDDAGVEELTTVELYEGKVEISYHGRNGAVHSKNLESPYQAKVNTTRKDVKGAVFAPVSDEEHKKVDLLKALEECGFIAIEVKNDKDLQERLLHADNGIGEEELQMIIDHAEEQLRIDQENARAEAEELEKKLKEVLLNITGEDEPNHIDFVFKDGGDTEKEPETEDTEQQENTEEPVKNEETKPVEKPQKPEEVKEETEEPSTEKEPEIEPEVKPEVKPEAKPETKEEEKETPAKDPQPEKKDDKTETKVPEAKTFTVTFKYDGKSYATEKVTQTITGILVENPKVEKPLLKPTKSGYWSDKAGGSEFDFTKPIDKDTTLYWVSN